MNRPAKIYSILLALMIASATSTFAQNTETTESKEAAYTKVITQRAGKIVATLGIADSSKAKKVRDIITQQYRDLNNIYTERDAKIKSTKEKGESKEVLDAALKNIETETTEKISKVHENYLAGLSSKLTAEQVVKVKDGMTYGVLPLTYNAYLDMLPNLTEQQKTQIMAWLTEAREHAMDAESSDKKHAWFGKYKGKINNYLSAAGIDMKKAGEDWQKRIESAAAAKKK
jgi:hypothetical protein